MQQIYIHGGLGNQMFQYAFYLYLKQHMTSSKTLSLDTSNFLLFPQHNGYELDRIFGIKGTVPLSFRNIARIGRWFNWSVYRTERKYLKYLRKRYGLIREKTEFGYDASMVDQSGCFVGYWQHHDYLDSIREELQHVFVFPDLTDARDLDMACLMEQSNSVSIHIRRGDYLLSKNSALHVIKGLDYYHHAIERMRRLVDNPTFFIFSDDPEWVKENLSLDQAHYINWHKQDTSYIDMQLMSLCKHNIIANSTFSFWGAWLNANKGKVVMAPQFWYDRVETQSLVPHDWQIIAL